MLALLLYLCQSSSSYSRSITAKGRSTTCTLYPTPSFPSQANCFSQVSCSKISQLFQLSWLFLAAAGISLSMGQFEASHNSILQSGMYDHESAQGEQQTICIFGVYFCRRCRNMMSPYDFNDSILYFKCQSCGLKSVDYAPKRGEHCRLLHKEYKAEVKRQVLDVNSIFDPSMPTVEVVCPECGFNKALYFLVADETESKMVARMMCKKVFGMEVRCGHVWDLEDANQLEESKVVIKELEDDEDDPQHD